MLKAEQGGYQGQLVNITKTLEIKSEEPREDKVAKNGLGNSVPATLHVAYKFSNVG